MAYSVEDLREMLSRTYGLPYGPGKTAAIEQVLRHTDAAGDPELSFDVRMMATDAYALGGEPAKSMVTFSWCLAEFDRDPGRDYHEAWSDTLLWQFKYMVDDFVSFPGVPLARTYALLDDMERRYREAGEQTQAVYHYRHVVARHVGDAEAAAHWYERWVTAPRDELSDCIGCDPRGMMSHLISTGRYADAIELGEATLAQPLVCVQQPQSVQNALMFPYLRTGRGQDAAEMQRRSYRAIKNDVSDMGDVGEHLEFCAVTGNEHRGLEMLERHLSWVPQAPSPVVLMDFAAAAGLLLRRLSELGHGDAPVRRGEESVPARELGAEMVKTARDLAAQFDARNGTAARSAGVERTLAATPNEVTVTLNDR